MLLFSNNFQTNPIDISRLFLNVTFNENIFTPHLAGSISISDQDGWLEALPILGEEHLLLDIEPTSITAIPPPLQYPNEALKGYFRIYKISPQERGQGKGSTYSLSFVSTEYFQSQKTKVFQTYKEKKISSIVQELYDRYIKKNIKSEYQKEIDIEPTLMLKNYVVPNISAIKALLNLAKEALSEKIENARGAIYVFYETTEKFHFKSLETLMSQKSKRKFLYQPKNMNTEEAGERKLLSEAKFGIDLFTIIHSFDVLQNMRKGMYASKLITYDFERMSYEEHTYNYINPSLTKREQQHLPTGDTVTIESDGIESSINSHVDRGKKMTESLLCTQNMELLTNSDSNITLQSTDQHQDLYFEKNHTRAGGFKEPGIKPKGIEDWVLQRSSQMQQLRNIQVEVLLSTGDASLHVGDIIELDIPSEILIDNSGNMSNKYYSGKYLISVITQVISPSDGFETTLTLLKNSLETVPDKLNKEIIEETKSFSKTIGLEKAIEFKKLKNKIRGFGSIRTPTAIVAIKG